MNNILPVFLLGLITVPFLFNSCQGGFKSQSSLSSFNNPLVCKMTLEEGVVKKMTHNLTSQPEPFAQSKLQLGESSLQGSSLQKAAGISLVPQGSELSAIYNNNCLREEHEYQGERLWTLISPDGQLEPLPELVTQAFAINLGRDYDVNELNELVELDPCVVGVSWDNTYKTSAVFSDPSLYQQAHLNQLRAMEAYDLAYGGDLSKATSVTSSVRVAVVDSGVDWQHPDLQGNFWVHSQGWGIDATTINSSLVNYNPFDVSSNGHGTHIAGLIAAVSNNNVGVVGTMPFNAKIMAVKVFKRNSSTGALETTSTHLYNGIQFAVLNGAEVINLSLEAQGSSYDSVLDSALGNALGAGITVFAAMGNGAPGKLVDGTTLKIVPAVYSTRSGVMGVGSYDSATGSKSSFSNYSTTYAEISAPGAENGTTQGIFSTTPTGIGGYGRLAGTSQSTAIVSGAAALSIAMIKKAYGMAPTPYEVERLILESADKNAALNAYFKDGNQLDLASLVARVHSDYPLTKTGGSVPPTECP